MAGGDPWGQEAATISLTDDAGANWREAILDARGCMEDVDFCTEVIGCAVGSDFGPDGDFAAGAVMRTVDGGRTWRRVLTTPRALRSLAFVDSQGGCAVGADGSLLCTTDAGATWRFSDSPTASTLYGIAAQGSGVLIAGSGGALLSSTDVADLPARARTSGLAPAGAAGDPTLEGFLD